MLDATMLVDATVVDPGNEYVEFCAKAVALNSNALKREACPYMVSMLAIPCLRKRKDVARRTTITRSKGRKTRPTANKSNNTMRAW